MLDTIGAGALTRLFGTDTDTRTRVFTVVTALTLVATLVLFVSSPSLASIPLVVFVLLVLYGLVALQSTTARLLTMTATVSTVITLGFITIFLFMRALPVLQEQGIAMFTLPAEGAPWAPRSDVFSLIPAAWGTVLTTLIAASIAGPLGLLGALFISEVAPDWAREIVKPGVEILAGIPSIVYGYIGLQVLNAYIQDAFIDEGASFFIAGTVIGIMALPTVVSVAEDALSSVPDAMKDGALAMGATRWQTMKSISIPAAFSGISAAVILGIGRAIGETMAVAVIMGAGVGLADPLFDVFDSSATLTSLIATQYGNATETTLSALFVAGVVLFVVVATLSVISQAIERRMQRKLRGEQ